MYRQEDGEDAAPAVGRWPNGKMKLLVTVLMMLFTSEMVHGNIAAEDTFEMISETVSIDPGLQNSRVKGAYTFKYKGYNGESTGNIDLNATSSESEAEVPKQYRVYGPRFYFPVVVSETEPDYFDFSEVFLETIQFKAEWKTNLLYSRIVKDVEIPLPKIPGTKVVWLEVYPLSAMPLNEFTIEINYLQPNYKYSSASRFAYIPLLPSIPDNKIGNYIIRILLSNKYDLSVLSTHSTLPTFLKSEIRFWPSDREPIIIQVTETKKSGQHAPPVQASPH